MQSELFNEIMLPETDSGREGTMLLMYTAYEGFKKYATSSEQLPLAP